MNDPKKTARVAHEKRTLVEEGTQFKGSLTSTCPIVVQGAVDGDLAGPSLTVSATGAVSGKVEAGELTTAGRIAGEFDVDAATIAGTVAHDTVVRAASLDLKLEVTRGKVQLSFRAVPPGGGSRRS